MKKGLKRIMTAALAGAMVFSLSACGNQSVNGGGNEQQRERQTPEWVYVPEYKELTGNGDYWSMKQIGDYLYYQSNTWDEETGESGSSLKRYSLLDGSEETLPLTFDDGGSLNSFEIGEDGSVYAMIYFWSNDEVTGDYKSWQALAKFDAEGNEVYNVELAELQEKEGIDSFGSMTVDGQGRVYITCDTKIVLFDEAGNYSGLVGVGNDMNSWINGVGRGADGKVYACCYASNGNSGGYQLSEIDFDKKSIGSSYSNFPSGNGNGLVSGDDNSFLVQDGTSVYRYDLASQTSEKLFDWLDSDINGQYVNNIGVTSEGKILAIINDWNTNEYSVAVLTKTPGSEVAQKETIIVGTMGASQELQSAAVAFNKASDKYRITIKQYVDNTAWTETTWSDAIANMNNDITSGNCPDIIDLSNLNVEQLAVKGVFENLAPYLENSTVLKREDYIESILEGYTFGDVLVGIPKTFSIQTVVGNSDDIGTEMGWSLEEMIAYADAHPNASLFDYNSKSNIMYYCMMYNEGTFVDWAKGKCNFDSPEFISLLEFVNRFPDEAEYDDEVSTPRKIQNGEVLLDTAYLSQFDDIQMYNAIFGGKANFIGFPTMDGSVGCAMYANDIYAITTKSPVKDGAWSFIESYLATADTNRWFWGFPTNKNQLDVKIEEATKVETYTWTDENGVEHEEVSGGGSSISYQDGWTYEYHTTTKEEVDQILALFDVAKPAASQNSEIMTIISEEAEAFYKGQKSAAEAADIIQRRAQVYVDENS